MKFLLCNTHYIDVEKIESISCNCTNCEGITDEEGNLTGMFYVGIHTCNHYYDIMETKLETLLESLKGSQYCMDEVLNFLSKYCLTTIKNMVEKCLNFKDYNPEIDEEVFCSWVKNELSENLDKFLM